MASTEICGNNAIMVVDTADETYVIEGQRLQQYNRRRNHVVYYK